MNEKGRKEERVEPLLLFQVLLCCRDTRHKNGDEFVVFIDERAALVKRLDQRLALDNEEPYECFPQFFQSDFHFVDEVLSRFGALCFAIIRCWRRAGSEKLAGNVISNSRIGQGFDDIQHTNCKFNQPFLQVIISVGPFRSSFITPCSIFDIQSA